MLVREVGLRACGRGHAQHSPKLTRSLDGELGRNRLCCSTSGGGCVEQVVCYVDGGEGIIERPLELLVRPLAKADHNLKYVRAVRHRKAVVAATLCDPVFESPAAASSTKGEGNPGAVIGTQIHGESHGLSLQRVGRFKAERICAAQRC